MHYKWPFFNSYVCLPEGILEALKSPCCMLQVYRLCLIGPAGETLWPGDGTEAWRTGWPTSRWRAGRTREVSATQQPTWLYGGVLKMGYPQKPKMPSFGWFGVATFGWKPPYPLMNAMNNTSGRSINLLGRVWYNGVYGIQFDVLRPNLGLKTCYEL
jgi:hypothetical protein